MRKTFLILLLLFVCADSLAQQDSPKNIRGATGTMQNEWMLKRLEKHFDKRRKDVGEALASKEKIEERQQWLREWYNEKVGILPPRPPLNPVYGKKINLEGYTIQPVIFESRPAHRVTALLYLPSTGTATYPAVYIPCGHTTESKAFEQYQKAARLFALNGFAVLVADPVCQGERYQYLDSEGKPLTREGTWMHEILGHGLLLTGCNTMLHELFDNIRCIDFLEQHPMVDPNRIAVAGNSGGGAQATYLFAFDDRIKVAVPSCYIATTEKKLSTIGAQDGCQQLWGEVEAGIEEQDFLLMAAPRPVSIVAASQDFFAIEGTRKAYDELKRMYEGLGEAEKISLSVYDFKHGWHKPLREESVRWCRQWLMNDPSPVVEPDDIGFFENISPLLATGTGQVLTEYKNERLLADISLERMLEARKKRNLFLNTHSRKEVIDKIRVLTGYQEPMARPEYLIKETIRDNGFIVQKILVERDKENGFWLPVLMFIPDKYKRPAPAVILVGHQGKEYAYKQDGRLQEALNKGKIVVSVSLSNTRELKDNRKSQYDNVDYWIGKLCFYEGRSLLTYQAEEIVIIRRFFQRYRGVKRKNISLYATGSTGPAALHAAAFEQGFRRVTVSGCIESWEDVASARYSKDQISNIVPGALNYYDLANLASLAPNSIFEILDPVDVMGNLKK